MTYLTIRNLPPDIGMALEAEKTRRGTSLNRTVIDLLRDSLGVPGTDSPQTNGLERFAGTWTPEEVAEFEAAIEFTEVIDPEVWQ